MPSPKKIVSSKKIVSLKKTDSPKNKPVVIQGNYIGKNFDPNFAAKFYKKSLEKVKGYGISKDDGKDLQRLGNFALLGGSIAGIILLLDNLASKNKGGPVNFVAASVDRPISPGNKGYKMLFKKGYSGSGRSPVKPGTPNIGRVGLGF